MNLHGIIRNFEKIKKNIKYALPTVIIILTFALFSCNSPIEPKKDNNTLPDTTSHNFTWQTFEFGDDGARGSALKDVAIVNDSDIWAVGEIYLNDSTGQPDPLPYNLVKWNGKEWKLEKISVDYHGNKTIAPLTGIFILSDDKVIFSSGLPYLPNGNNSWKLYHLWDMGVLDQDDGSVNQIWGTSINDLYFAGIKGTIAHHQNGIWNKMSSWTTTNLTDIWGNSDGSTIWACGYAMDYSQSCILKFDGSDWKTIWSTHAISTPPYGYFVSTIWMGDTYLYVGAGDGIYRTPLKGNDSTEKVLSLQLGPYRIRGSAENNIAMACSDGSIWHYNGSTWFQETPSYIQKPVKPLFSIAVSKNTIVAVGFDATNISWKGIIIMGRRN